MPTELGKPLALEKAENDASCDDASKAQLELLLRFDMRAPSFGADATKLHAAALEMAAWADRQGFDTISLPEHHGMPDGYCPRPFLLAAAIAARTARLRLRLSAVVLPLHDPIAMAEQINVLDQLSAGRVEVVLGMGYVPAEYEMFGVPWEGRVTRFERAAELLIAALEGKPFDVEGRRGVVTPRAVQHPRPPVFIGGRVPAAARRAARLADGFITVDPTDELRDAYFGECERLGRTPGRVDGYGVPPIAVFVAEDPEEAWRSLLPHAVHDSRAYGDLVEGDLRGYNPYVSETGREVRERGTYAVLTPDECVALARQRHAAGLALPMVPLLGGLEPDVGWASLELFGSAVLPILRAEGLVGPASAATRRAPSR